MGHLAAKQKMTDMEPAKLVAQESRKLRNRLSQKAHRARQCMRIKELEERLDSRSLSESSRVRELEQQNVALRDHLLNCHKKLESLQVTVRAISDSTANAVGMEIRPNKCNSRKNSRTSDSHTPDQGEIRVSERENEEDGDSDDSAQPIENGDHRWEPTDTTFINVDSACLDVMVSQLAENTHFSEFDDQQLSLVAANTNPDLLDLGQLLDTRMPQSGGLATLDCNNTFSSPLNQNPLMFSFTHMGPAAYADISEKGALLVQGPHGQLRRTNSLFSDHVTVLEYFLRQKWMNVGALMNREDECLANSVSFMLSAFVCMSWQKMTAWHTYTKAHIPVGKLMTWHLNPTAEAYNQISANYKPTRIQLSVPHPSIIDWIPWPAMRDKLILCHSANPRLDDLICEIGNSYVVEGDLSKLIANVRPTMGFVGVWDLVRAIAPEATAGMNGPSQGEGENGAFDPEFPSDGSSPHCSLDDSDAGIDVVMAPQLPAPNITALFSSKTFALQAFKEFRMDQGAVTFRLDPAFFEQHPELYDSKGSLIAQGVPLRPPMRTSVPCPRALDTCLLGRYRELTTWTFDLSFDRVFQQGVPCTA